MRGPNYGSKKIPKESRTIPVRGNKTRGNGEDFGILFKCWYCGFICKEGRDALGGSSSRSGLVHEEAPTPSEPTDTKSSLCIDRGSVAKYVLMELDSNGNPKTISHTFKAVSGNGCPLCGSLNWKGIY